MKLAPCTREEFDGFMNQYPRALEKSVLGFCDPPVVEYHDFTLGADLPVTLVARYRWENATDPEQRKSDFSIWKEAEVIREVPEIMRIRTAGYKVGSGGFLIVDGLHYYCGELKDDIGVRFEGDKGGWVISFADLEELVRIARLARSGEASS